MPIYDQFDSLQVLMASRILLSKKVDGNFSQFCAKQFSMRTFNASIDIVLRTINVISESSDKVDLD